MTLTTVVIVLTLGMATTAVAQTPGQAIGQTAERQGAPPVDPWAQRPECDGMFLNSDWILSSKQHRCYWIQEGIFSTSGLAGAAWSAEWSKLTDSASERGDGYWTRFGRKWTQSAIKNTGAYVGQLLNREDPRKFPPYLVMQTNASPHGFLPKMASAVTKNVTAYRCVSPCTSAGNIKRRVAVSRMLASLASGWGGELVTRERPHSAERAWRGVASAYAATFADAAFTEFKPELTAAVGRTFRILGGGR